MLNRTIPSPDVEIRRFLDNRLGRLHVRQRLGIEAAHEARAVRQELGFFQVENWYSFHGLVRAGLRFSGLVGRGRRNAQNVLVRHNRIEAARLPHAFEGFTLLHLSDLHADISQDAMHRVEQLLPALKYDLCVLTGDFRGKTFGPFDEALDGLTRLRAHLRAPVFAVLGNHDTIRMVPGLEAMGIRVLLNECEAIKHDGTSFWLAGIDDAHFYRLDNIEKAGDPIPEGAFSVLLSHTPEVYRQAAHAGFDLMLSGHTHGGQICLPGGVPVMLESKLPRRLGAGAWSYHGMAGYTSAGAGTSITAARFNCAPEITLHRLTRGLPM